MSMIQDAISLRYFTIILGLYCWKQSPRLTVKWQVGKRTGSWGQKELWVQIDRCCRRCRPSDGRTDQGTNATFIRGLIGSGRDSQDPIVLTLGIAGIYVGSGLYQTFFSEDVTPALWNFAGPVNRTVSESLSSGYIFIAPRGPYMSLFYPHPVTDLSCPSIFIAPRVAPPSYLTLFLYLPFPHLSCIPFPSSYYSFSLPPHLPHCPPIDTTGSNTNIPGARIFALIWGGEWISEAGIGNEWISLLNGSYDVVGNLTADFEEDGADFHELGLE
ncbi:hypothetical protein D9758_010812 [Tetrapyrgos nigripes]|uniref:Uncharacterized protein n=1 Tax=Tetrapyrgos nigripes TaxID=182062 RepID=A0A8H5GI36_9AGAR|nr:hypothetical protein D9758_010812 [Tetrapyrgos nigripes]